VAFSDPTRLIVSASADRTATAWSPFQPRAVHTLTGHSAPLVTVK